MNRIIVIVFISSIIFSCSKDNNPNPTKIEIEKYDQAKIDEAYGLISQVPSIRSMVISHEFETIAEQYYNNTTSGPDSILDVRSVTKSISSALIGIALDMGYLTSVDQKLSEFITPLTDSLDQQKGDITIKQLLTMTAGFEWFEIAEPSEFGNFIYAPNQLEYVLNKPMIHTPGTVFDYSDGAAHLVSIVISQATGMSASEFADEYLFKPMGIDHRFWYEDNQGHNYGGAGICIGPVDMIKFGELYLNHGKYNGVQVISETWIVESTSINISTNNIVPFLTNYGYYWWIGHEKNYDFYCAMGYGGQFIIVVPELELVMAATCDFRGLGSQAGQNWNRIINILLDNVLDAFIEN